MKLTNSGIQNRAQWEEKGYILPSYDRAQMIAQTHKTPQWVHFGAGNIFRIFPAALAQELLNKQLIETGIIVGEGFDYEIIDEVFAKHDNLTLAVTLKSDGSIEKEVIASVASAHKCDPQYADEWAFFQAIFQAPTLQLISMTITEKGYSLLTNDGSFLPFILADLEAGPAEASSFIPKLTALLYERYRIQAGKLTLLSMDNCSHNGDKLALAVQTVAAQWHLRGFVDEGFNTYLKKQVSYPWSMIDKITPHPDTNVQEMLSASGFADTSVIVTAKHTHTAAFVNAEEPEYLVIEDAFGNGRPPLEKVGVYLTDRTTVDQVERMKVTTCLNPLHTALAIFGTLLGYRLISEEMQDPQLRRMVERIGYDEGMPVVVDPKILDPKAFIDEVLTVRFPNPFMPDTPQRIVTDTSQKLSIRFGETIKAYLANPELDVDSLQMIPLVYAGWLRYLLGLDDELAELSLSPDPRLEEAQAYLTGIAIGDRAPYPTLLPLLEDTTIWGVDLVAIGMAPKVIEYFQQLIAGPGAVRKTLQESVQ